MDYSKLIKIAELAPQWIVVIVILFLTFYFTDKIDKMHSDTINVIIENNRVLEKHNIVLENIEDILKERRP